MTIIAFLGHECGSAIISHWKTCIAEFMLGNPPFCEYCVRVILHKDKTRVVRAKNKWRRIDRLLEEEDQNLPEVEIKNRHLSL